MELKTGSYFRDWLPVFNQILDTRAIVLVPGAHFESSCVGAVLPEVAIRVTTALLGPVPILFL
jgi:hypothetical protein